MEVRSMSRVVLGVLCGIVFDLVSVAAMIPRKIVERQRALLGASANRFAVGFVIYNASLPWTGRLNGLVFGLLVSSPDAIITKTWAQILIVASIGGVVIGIIAG